MLKKNDIRFLINCLLYSKTQSSEIKQAFWTAFGQYMALQPGAEGARINWINYKTGFKHIKFKMQADTKSASISIQISHPDLGVQQLMFEQFWELKKVLVEYLEEPWDWKFSTMDENNKPVSLIRRSIDDVSIYRKEDWPALISFFKQRIIALDNFWLVAQNSFEAFL